MSVRISLLALVACAPEPAPIVAPMAAPPDLEVTMDPGVHGILEDEARRHAPPPAALRQRVYHVERRFFRWFHPGPGEPRRNWNWPLKGEMADFPADRVVLQGQPPPVAGERFVLFDDTGPRGVVEATGERCPPGHDDCIACTEHDPLRRHWARFIGEPFDITDVSDALGPFAAHEPLPAPKVLQASWVRRGRWETRDLEDLDGDGEADRRIAHGDCYPERGCGYLEHWRRYDGRWYAEPSTPRPAPPPLHLLQPDQLLWAGVRYWGRLAREQGDAPLYYINTTDLDDERPRAGDYWLVTRRGVIGRMRFPERPRSVMNYGGPNSYEAAFVGEPPPVPRDAVLLAGPIPADTTVHTITMQRRPYPDLEDQRRPAAEFSLILSDGRRWTVSHHACAEIGGKPVSWMGEHSSRSECIVSEQDLPDGGVDRRVLGSFQRWGMERICRHLQLPPPPAAAARRR